MTNYELRVLLLVARNYNDSTYLQSYMRFYLACIILFLTTIHSSFGQAYKYIGVTEGLSDRRVLSIQKDRAGFMWFLTYTGIDRYDGKEIKHYRLHSEEGYISFYSERNILKTDTLGNVWAIGPEGQLFKYIPSTDRFIQKLLPEEILSPASLNLVKMTDFNEIWYCHLNHCYIYNLNTGLIQQIELDHRHKHVTSIFQSDKNTYYIGSDDGICMITLKDGKVHSSKCLIPSNLCLLPNTIYYHSATNRLFAGSEITGLLVYDLTLNKVEKQYPFLKDFPINSFHPYHTNKVLIPTRGAGVQLYDLQNEKLEQWLYADVYGLNKMNGNNIRTLFVDNRQRIWMSVYARSITIYDQTLPDFNWFKNYIGNKNSLNDDLVNAVLEDSDGDIWFATNNGLSIYRVSDGTWSHLFPWDNSNFESMRNTIFLSLCEVSPGKIFTGGFMTGVYHIDKATMTAEQLTPQSYLPDKGNPTLTNKYIRVIYKDKDGLIWTGGNNYLECTNLQTKEFKYYALGNSITCIAEIDSHTLLIGTGNGMYKFDKRSEEISHMRMPFASQQINSMYLHPCGDLYIGTTNSGLVILRTDGKYEQYININSALLSNTINTIVPKNQDEIIIATEQNIALFNNKKKTFTNWTEDQGLIKANFAPRAGIHTSRNTFIIGSDNGAIEWMDDMKLKHHKNSEILFDQILIENEHASQTIINKANIHNLDSINVLSLKPDQRSISIHISTIDYSNPQYTYFQWRLAGRYNYWRDPGKENWLEFRNLKPGEYILQVQNISKEDNQVLGEKQLKIIIPQPLWLSNWAIVLYLFCIISIVTISLRYLWMKRERKNSKEKNRFFIGTVNGMRIPLSLMDVSIKEVIQQENISHKSENYLQIAGYSIQNLNLMLTNLLNIERHYKRRKLEVKKLSINKLLEQYVTPFSLLTKQENIRIHFTHEEEDFFAWVHVEKIELIFYNILSNLIKHTKENSTIYIATSIQKNKWTLTLCNDTELLSPTHKPTRFRKALNHMNKKGLHSEMYIINQLIESHFGHLQYDMVRPSGYLFTVSFPLKDPHYIKSTEEEESTQSLFHEMRELFQYKEMKPLESVEVHEKRGHILLVEKDRKILNFLDNTLYEEWNISIAHDARIAIDIVKEYEPDIVITSFDVPKEGEFDLCTILKSNTKTSHIPIILITSNEDREHITEGLKLRADYFVTKPFDLLVLKSVIQNIVENRHLLQERLSQVDIVHNLKEIRTANVEMDTKFLNDMKNLIRQHINNPKFNVDELCSKMGMSRTNLYNKVKLLTHQSLSDIIREIRLQRAAELLLSNEYNIMEVSDMMGFSETKYFREVFKKHFGMTPSDYIKMMKEKKGGGIKN